MLSKDDDKIAMMLGATTLALLLFAAAHSAEPKSNTLTHWYEGPVRYLLTRREEKEFRALSDDPARSEFIRLFWRRRDPIPETPENEARISFWRRVVEANGLFRDSALPGWKTDRGKIYLLVGPPTEVREDTHFVVGDATNAQAGLVRWIYDGVLKGAAFSGTYVIAFVRENDGEYHLSNSARLSSPGFDPLASYDRSTVNIARIQSSLDYGPSDLGTYLDLGLLQAPPWQEKDFIDRVTSEAFIGALPMRVSFEFLRASDGSTFAVITCAVPFAALGSAGVKSAQPEITVVARLAPEGGAEPVDIPEIAFAAAPTNASAAGDMPLLFQARTPLRPGHYDLYVGMFERVRLRAANLRTSIEVPNLVGPLAISSIVLGSSLRPVPEGTGGYNRPFRISDFEVIPSVGSYKVGDSFSALWQIYTDGPTGPGSGLEITRQFVRLTESGEAPHGRPVVIEDGEAVQAFSVALTGWPPSGYRLDVTARDRTGRSVTRSAGFTVQ